MPTDRQRLNALVKAGLLPETAQDIVDFGDALIQQPEALAARVTDSDKTRARVFVLYSPIIPDRLRLLWSAPETSHE